jgi:hypothetical protein
MLPRHYSRSHGHYRDPRPAFDGDDDEEEEMSKEDSPDEDNGFHIDRSIHHRCRNRLQELSEEAESEVTVIQHQADDEGIALIEFEQTAKCGLQCD